jgi:hypothetical protein
LIRIRNRIPDKKDLFLVFLVCVFPIHLWAMIQFLRDIPSYILWVSWFEIFSIFSYTQSIALVESFLFFILITAIALIFPRSLVLDYYPSQSTINILLFSTTLISYHYREFIFPDAITLPRPTIILVIVLTILFFSISICLRFFPKIEHKLVSSIKRVTILSSIYLIIAIFGFLFSTVRIITTYILWTIQT